MRDDYKPMGITAQQERYQPNALPIAITGASYAGLTLGNVLHLHSIPYAIFDSKSPPYTHVTGGAKFNIQSYELVAKKLELDVAKYCVADNGPTRKEVIDSLLQRVTPNLFTSQRILRIENRSGLFYLHSISTTTTASNKNQSGSICGPYRRVVGADGVLSKIRTSSLLGTFLCGDARWVNDRWYDLGLQRIDRGADIALQDGLELGEALANNKSMGQSTRNKFCAFEISWGRTRRRVAFSFAILALFACKFQSEISQSIYIIVYTLKDAIFSDDCLSHN